MCSSDLWREPEHADARQEILRKFRRGEEATVLAVKQRTVKIEAGIKGAPALSKFRHNLYTLVYASDFLLPAVSGALKFVLGRLQLAFWSLIVSRALLGFVAPGILSASLLNLPFLSFLKAGFNAWQLPHTFRGLFNIAIIVLGLKLVGRGFLQFRNQIQDVWMRKTIATLDAGKILENDSLAGSDLVKGLLSKGLIRGKPWQIGTLYNKFGANNISGNFISRAANYLYHYSLPNITAFAMTLTAPIAGLLYLVHFASRDLSAQFLKNHPYYQLWIGRGKEFGVSYWHMWIIGAEIQAVVGSGKFMAEHAPFSYLGGTELGQIAELLEGNHGSALGFGGNILNMTQKLLGLDFAYALYQGMGGTNPQFIFNLDEQRLPILSLDGQPISLHDFAAEASRPQGHLPPILGPPDHPLEISGETSGVIPAAQHLAALQRMAERISLPGPGVQGAITPMRMPQMPAGLALRDPASSTDNEYLSTHLRGPLTARIADNFARGEGAGYTNITRDPRFREHASPLVDSFSQRYERQTLLLSRVNGRDISATLSYHEALQYIASFGRVITMDLNGLPGQPQNFRIFSMGYRDTNLEPYIILDREFFQTRSQFEVAAKLLHELAALFGHDHATALAIENTFLFLNRNLLSEQEGTRFENMSPQDIQAMREEASRGLMELEQRMDADARGGFRDRAAPSVLPQPGRDTRGEARAFSDAQGLGELNNEHSYRLVFDYSARYPSEYILLVFANISRAQELPTWLRNFARDNPDTKVLLVTSETIAAAFNAGRAKRGNTIELRLIQNGQIIGGREVTSERIQLIGSNLDSARYKVVRDYVIRGTRELTLRRFVERLDGGYQGSLYYSSQTLGFIFTSDLNYADISEWEARYSRFRDQDYRMLSEYMPRDSQGRLLSWHAAKFGNTFRIYFNSPRYSWDLVTTETTHLERLLIPHRSFPASIYPEMLRFERELMQWSLSNPPLEEQRLRISRQIDTLKMLKAYYERQIKNSVGGFDDVVVVTLPYPIQATAIIIREGNHVHVEVQSSVRADAFSHWGQMLGAFSLTYNASTGMVEYIRDGRVYEMPYSELPKAWLTLDYSAGRLLAHRQLNLEQVRYLGREAVRMRMRDTNTGQVIDQIIMVIKPPASRTGHIAFLEDLMNFVLNNRQFTSENPSIIFNTFTAASIYNDVLVPEPLVTRTIHYDGNRQFQYLRPSPSVTTRERYYFRETVAQDGTTEIIRTRRIGDTMVLANYRVAELQGGIRTDRPDVRVILNRDLGGNITRRFAIERGKVSEYLQFYEHPTHGFVAAYVGLERLRFDSGREFLGQRVVRVDWNDSTQTITIYRDDIVEYGRVFEIPVLAKSAQNPQGVAIANVRAVGIYNLRGELIRVFAIRGGSESNQEYLKFYRDPDRREGYVAVFTEFETVNVPAPNPRNFRAQRVVPAELIIRDNELFAAAVYQDNPVRYAKPLEDMPVMVTSQNNPQGQVLSGVTAVVDLTLRGDIIRVYAVKAGAPYGREFMQFYTDAAVPQSMVAVYNDNLPLTIYTPTGEQRQITAQPIVAAELRMENNEVTSITVHNDRLLRYAQELAIPVQEITPLNPQGAPISDVVAVAEYNTNGEFYRLSVRKTGREA